VNPGHKTAPERLARVAMMRRAEGKATYTTADLNRLVKKDPLHHLPLLAEALIEQNDWPRAEKAFDQFLDILDTGERLYYFDL